MTCHLCYQSPCLCQGLDPEPMAFLWAIQEYEIEGIKHMLENLSKPPSNLNTFEKDFANEEKRADIGSIRGARAIRGKEPNSGNNG